MSGSTKIMTLVLEAAEHSLIRKWCREGHLPALDKLMKQGVWSTMETPGYISSGCVWASFTCGINPGKHGFGFFHRQLKSGTYRTIKRYADELEYEHVWIPASRAGKRVAIMDIPLSRPQTDLNGYLICRWGDEHPSWKPSSMPGDLLDDIKRRFGAHPLDDWYQTKLDSAEDWLDWKNKLATGVRKRTDIVKYLMGKEPLDLLIVNYAEPHWAAHVAWHLLDENHPEYDAALVEQCGNIILDTYKKLDAGIAELVEANPEATFFVLSPIGMGSHTGGELMTPEILKRLNLQGDNNAKPPTTSRGINIFPGKDGMSQAVQSVEKIISPATMEKVKKFVPERLWDNLTRRFLSLGTDWKSSRVFVVPGDNASLLRINLKGREPNGMVEPGEEYERVCDELIATFSEIKEVSTGKSAVKKIVPLRKVLWGEHLDEMPDLAVVWREGVPLEEIESPRIGRIKLNEYHKRSGGHSEQGFIIASGPGIRKGVELDNVEVLGFAPTVLYLMGLPIPQDMDGKVWLDIIDEKFKAQKP